MNEKETTLVFTGDIGFDRYMANKWEDEALLSPSVMDFFRSADHVVANVEGAIISCADSEKRETFFHAMDPDATTFFQKIGADVWCIANNHIMDADREGLKNTVEVAEKMGCRAIGAGMDEKEASLPFYVDSSGGIGILALSYRKQVDPTYPGPFSWTDMEGIAARIAEIKSKCRWCIIVSHGGEEFAPLPLPYTRERYLKYLEMGADVVVGHHPHVVENYELFADGKAIFYSLGNFIFDTDYQRVQRYTDLGVLLKLTFTDRSMSFDAMGIKLVRGEQRIVEASLPAIFTDVCAAEYELLAPLCAKAFISCERKKMIYLKPERFTDASVSTWESYFFSDTTDEKVKGIHMDLGMIYPLSLEAEAGEWKKSKLESVKNYVLELI